MKQESQVLVRDASLWHSIPEKLPPCPDESSHRLSRLTLGGALCGGFAGSFAGALLGAAFGAIFSNLSLGLDGALIGSALAVPAGAVYGLIVALREKRQGSSPDEDALSP